MKPEPTLSIDQMMGAKLNNLIRLANYIGIDIQKYLGKPDQHWRIATAIARWYKQHPQKKKRSYKIRDSRAAGSG